MKNNNIRLVAIDLDDTLLNHKKEISPVNLRTLHKVRELGIQISLVTGRMYAATTRFAEMLGIDVPVVTYQGGLIRTGLTHQTLFEAPLSPMDSIVTCKLLELHGGMVNAAVDDIFIADSESVIADRYRNFHRMPVQVVGPLSRWLETQAMSALGPIYKLIYQDDEARITEVMQNLTKDIATIQVTRSYPHILEIGPKGIHKGFAIHWLAEYYGIQTKDVMVIGDGGNDIDMFQVAGFSVCMGNGQDLAKQSADFVGKSNEDDGVADALNRFILQKE